MWFMRKLKEETSINMLLPALITIIGLVLLWVIFNRWVAWGFVASVFIFYSLFSFYCYVRIRSMGYLVAFLFQSLGGLWVGGLHHGIFYISDKTTSLFGAGAVIFMIWMQLLLLTRKFKWRGREILELAAQPVEDVTDGFTERPRPLGGTSLSREDALGFARFASRNLIAMPYVEKDRVVFVPVSMAQSFRHLYPWGGDYRDATWVAVDNTGKVSVNIARKDYLTYKDSLSFDQLCESLGNLFVDFMGNFKRGEGVRVIDRMNDLRVNPYT